MAEKNLHIEHGGNVSKEILLAYVRGQLNEVDKIRLEKLIAEDEFLKDAVEGLRNSNTNSIENSLAAINRRVDKRTGTNKPFTISPVIKKYAAAASIVFFLGLTFIIMDRLNKESINQKEIASEPALNKQDATAPGDTGEIKSDMGGGTAGTDTIFVTKDLSGEIFNDATIISRSEATEIREDEKFEPVIAANFSVVEEIDLSAKSLTQINAEEPELSLDRDGVKDEFEEKQMTTGSTTGAIELETADKNSGLFKKEKVNKERKKADSENNAEAAPTTFDLYQVADDIISDSLIINENKPGGEVNIEPQFPGGMDSLNLYMQKALTSLNGNIYKDGMVGNVEIKFLINEDGSVSNAYIEKGIGKEYDDKALQAIRLMPRWQPGKQGNVNVKVWYTLIVKF
ncbi:MAG: energy transducer TonB [Chitinophagales bacterium]